MGLVGGVGFPEEVDAVFVGDGEGAEDDGVDHGEQRDAEADAQRENCGGQGVFGEGAEGEAGVAGGGFEAVVVGEIADGFGDGGGVAEAVAGVAGGLFFGVAGIEALLAEEVEVLGKFVVDGVRLEAHLGEAHDLGDGGGGGLPAGAFHFNLLAAGFGEGVIAGLAVGGGCFQFGFDPAVGFEAAEGGVERSVVNGEGFLRALFDALAIS